MNATSIAPAPTREGIDAALAAAGIPVGAGAAPLVVAAGRPLRVVFATPAACALLRAASLDALTEALFVAPGVAGQRLAETLARLEPEAGARLERLRLAFGPRAETVTFQLSRLPGPTAAVLLSATGVRPSLLADTHVTEPLRLPAEVNAPSAPATRAPKDAAAVHTELAARFGGTPTVRFLWQTDAEGRFVSITNHLCEAVGCMTQSLVGQSFTALAARLGLDPDGRLASALARPETWSGIELAWPVRDANAVLPITVGALPSFGRDRDFDGFRGFGVIHLDRVRDCPIVPTPAPEHEKEPETVEAVEPTAEAAPVQATGALVAETHAGVTAYGENVVRLRTAGGPVRGVARGFGIAPAELDLDPAESVELSPGERMAFREIARALGARAGDERAEGGEAGGPARDLIDFVARASGSIATGDAVAQQSVAPAGEAPAGAAPPAEPDARLLAAEADAREARRLLDTTSEAILALDGEGNILSTNRAACDAFGYEPAELSGKPFAALFEADSQPAVLAQMARIRVDVPAEAQPEGDIFGRTRHGTRLPLQIRFSRLDGAGDTGRIAVTSSDLSARRRVERDLENARREAERASALKSEFLAKVSHEIRTPLNAILGFAEVIMDERFGPVGNERYRDYLKDIHASGTHVMSLVNDLLDLSKIEAGRMELDSDPVDLNRVVSECVSLMQPQANTERVIVRLSLASRLPQVLGDERSLRQIVLNLLSNAVKFNEPGGQVIVSTAMTDAKGIVLRVRDTGIGMTEADLEIALEPFRQVATARGGGKVSGTGLGLPLTKALVEANRASFTIRSRKDEGTLVEVAFPAGSVVAS